MAAAGIHVLIHVATHVQKIVARCLSASRATHVQKWTATLASVTLAVTKREFSQLTEVPCGFRQIMAEMTSRNLRQNEL